jgi:lipoyl(octanoyl) transferase
VEHDRIVTLGRSADRAHVLDPSLDVVATNRGGDVTAHGPGQLVIYPIVRLAKGVVAFVESVGGAIASELHARGVRDAAWKRDPAGVWVREKKIAACGLHIKRRVAAHGFALNVAAGAREIFDGIVPCGLAAPVTAIEHEVGNAPALEELADALADRIAAALGRARSPTRVDFRAIMSIDSCDRMTAR